MRWENWSCRSLCAITKLSQLPWIGWNKIKIHSIQFNCLFLDLPQKSSTWHLLKLCSSCALFTDLFWLEAYLELCSPLHIGLELVHRFDKIWICFPPLVSAFQKVWFWNISMGSAGELILLCQKWLQKLLKNSPEGVYYTLCNASEWPVLHFLFSSLLSQIALNGTPKFYRFYCWQNWLFWG